LVLATVLVLATIGAQAQCAKPTPLPTFNDSTYYRTAHAATTATELRRALETTAATGFIDLTYSCIWTVLEEADQDPNNSSNVRLLYTDESWPKAERDTGSSTTGWNREHVWPKSHGFPDESDLPYCDAHHLRAAEKRVNNRRSDKDFDEGGTAFCLQPYGGSTSDCEILSYDTTTTFEVPEFHRGDVARMALYLDLRYGSTEYELQLVDRSTYRSSLPELGFLCTLLQWQKEDPVSSFEQGRNQVVWYYQGNRNPFIDHPEWVDELWAGVC